MNVLLSLLHSSPEYESLRTMLDAGQTAAVSGVSQIARAHWIAALHEDTGRPVVAVCQDEMAASRLAAELTAFLGQPPVTLPSRELTFLDAAGVSREWEQRRLRILYDLSAGRRRTRTFELCGCKPYLCIGNLCRTVNFANTGTDWR